MDFSGFLPETTLIVILAMVNGLLCLFPEDYQTLSGFLMDELGHIPKAGEKLLW